MTQDYAVTMQDSTGRKFDLHINGASIDEMTALYGAEDRSIAAEELESNAFANAIDRGQIGADAWMASSTLGREVWKVSTP